MLAIAIPSLLKTKKTFLKVFMNPKDEEHALLALTQIFLACCEKRNRVHFNPQNVGIKDTCTIPELKKKKKKSQRISCYKILAQGLDDHGLSPKPAMQFYPYKHAKFPNLKNYNLNLKYAKWERIFVINHFGHSFGRASHESKTRV